MQRRKDYYQLLGVRRNASVRAIKRAFLKLRGQVDGQGAGQGAGRQQIADLQTAFETLSDHDRRRRYDETLRVGDLGPPGLAWSLLKHPDGSDLKRPVEPGALTAEVFLTDSEARSGGLVTLEIPVPSTCDHCGGTGGATLCCEACDGDGVTHHRIPVPLRIPPGAPSGTVFQVRLDEPLVSTLLLTVYTRLA